MLCILLTHNGLDKCIRDINYCHITTFLCINYTGQHHSLSSDCGRANILLGDKVMLPVPTNDLASLDGTISLLLYKDVGL